MAGRKKDSIWLFFSELETVSGKGLKAKCKTCGKEMMGLVSRMKKHKELCRNLSDDDDSSIIPQKTDEIGKYLFE